MDKSKFYLNKIYFIQTKSFRTGARQCWIVSSPSREEAEKLLVEGGWVVNNGYGFEILSSEEVENIVDTDEEMNGKTYIKMHN